MEPTNTNISPVQSEINPQPITPKPTKSFPFVLVLGIAIGIALTVSVVSAVYYFSTKAKKQETINNSDTASTEIITNTPTSSQTYGQFGSIAWLNQPQKISKLDIFNGKKPDTNKDEEIYFDEANFYLIANLEDGSQLINLFLPFGGMGKNNQLYRLIKSPNGDLYILKDDSDSLILIKDYLSDEIKTMNLTFTDLTPPESLSIENSKDTVYFNRGYLSQSTFGELESPKLVKSTDYGDLYVVYTAHNDNSGIYSRNFYLKLKDWTIYTYSLKTYLLHDDQKVSFNWLNGDKTNSQFIQKNSNGCGTSYSGPDVIKNGSSLINSKEKTGNVNTDTFVYQINDPNNSLVKNLYSEYKSF